MRCEVGFRAGVVAALLFLGACAKEQKPAQDAADLVIKNARIYTVDPASPWATSLAIDGGKIAAVGIDEQVAPYIGEKTRVVDLGGKLVLPGFHDVHAHPVWGGLSYSQCPIYEGTSPKEYQQLVAKCVAAKPGKGWLYGIGWKPGIFVPNGVPDKKLLDEIAPDRPVAISSVGGHTLWVNSEALRVAGITRDTKDPPNGRIDRDPKTGEPVGGLQEFAMSLVSKLLPPPTREELDGALVYATKYFNGVGIVGWQDASVSVLPTDPSHLIDVYSSSQQRGELKSHVKLALLWENERGAEQLQDLLDASARLAKVGVQAKTVKMFIDGVLVPRTGALIEPYADQHDTRGELQIPLDVYNKAIADLDARGFQVHVHAIGDLAVRSTLDAFAKAREINGPKDNRHLMSHLNLITPEDQPRFAQLGVVPVFQPLWAQLDEYMRMTAVRVGPERMKYMYPSGSVLRSGATIAYGSDWAVASANPLEGIEVALTRRAPGATGGDQLVPEEAITLEQAIRGYTLNAAFANHVDEVSGSLQVGKSADLVVLDQDIFNIAVTDIGRTKVLATLIAGEAVHGTL
jgi:predicted amidohydrolase YtcJ